MSENRHWNFELEEYMWQGRKVLLIDADAQCNLADALEWNEPDKSGATLAAMLEKVMQDKEISANEGILHHN